MRRSNTLPDLPPLPPHNQQRPLTHPMFICISSSAFGPTTFVSHRNWPKERVGWEGAELEMDGGEGKTHLYICVQIRGRNAHSWRVCGRPDSTGWMMSFIMTEPSRTLNKHRNSRSNSSRGRGAKRTKPTVSVAVTFPVFLLCCFPVFLRLPFSVRELLLLLLLLAHTQIGRNMSVSGNICFLTVLSVGTQVKSYVIFNVFI